MINAAYIVLAVAGALFSWRIVHGPTLSDRSIGVDGAIVVGISLIVVHAVATGQGAFLPVAVVLALVSFISTSIVARFIEGRRE